VANVPPTAETRPLIVKKRGQKWLDQQLTEMRVKYKGFDDDILHWLIADHDKIPVPNIKAGNSASEGEEISIAQMEANAEDQDILDTWTVVEGGVFSQPKKQAKYALPRAVVVDIVRGTTSKDTDKIDLILSDGTGTSKCVAYGKAVDLIVQSKVRKGDVIKLPLLNGQYGYWTKKGQKGQQDEEILWHKFSLPPFGTIHKLDLSIAEVLMNADQDLVKAKDSAYLDGLIVTVDPDTKDTCTACFRWYDEKKAAEHKQCKGAEIAEVTSYVGTMTTRSSQIHKLIWSPDVRSGTFAVKMPKFEVCKDLVRVFGKVTDRNTLMVSGLIILDGTKAPEEPVAKSVKAKKPAVQEDPDEEDEEEPAAPAPQRRRAAKAIAEPEDDSEDEEEVEEAPAPRRRSVKTPEPVQDDEDEEDEKVITPREEQDREDAEDLATRSPPRRVLRKAAPKAEPEEDDEEEDEDDAPAPPPRRKPVVPAPVDEEDVAPSPFKRRLVKPAPEPQDDEEDDEDADGEEEEVVAAAPVRRRPGTAPKPVPQPEGDEEDDEEEDDEVPASAPSKAKPKGASDKVTDFVVTSLTNLGHPQRTYLLGKQAVKKGLIECDDPEDVDAVNEAFQPHLDAAIKAGALKYADDKRQKVWLAKDA
jgi:hypothetical protein